MGDKQEERGLGHLVWCFQSQLDTKNDCNQMIFPIKKDHRDAWEGHQKAEPFRCVMCVQVCVQNLTHAWCLSPSKKRTHQ